MPAPSKVDCRDCSASVGTKYRHNTSFSHLDREALLVMTGLSRNCASAAFVDGVEHFDGTSVDESAWYLSGTGSVSVQDGCANFFYQHYYISSREVTAGIGDRIFARVMVPTAEPDSAQIIMGLNSNLSSPNSGPRVYANALRSDASGSRLTLFAGTTFFATGQGISATINPGSWYRLELHRVSLNSFTAHLNADEGTTLYNRTREFTSLPAQTGIFIGGAYNTRFDWISVPEPKSALLILILCRTCCKRQKIPKSIRP